jgi:uncharacterized protein YhbP (UPF0306 family)
VIGGGAAAAVVFARRVAEQALGDPRVVAARAALSEASDEARRHAQEAYERTLAMAEVDAQNALAREFDTVHSVERALKVGSLDGILPASELRRALCSRLDAAIAAYLQR